MSAAYLLSFTLYAGPLYAHRIIYVLGVDVYYFKYFREITGYSEKLTWKMLNQKIFALFCALIRNIECAE